MVTMAHQDQASQSRRLRSARNNWALRTVVPREVWTRFEKAHYLSMCDSPTRSRWDTFQACVGVPAAGRYAQAAGLTGSEIEI